MFINSWYRHGVVKKLIKKSWIFLVDHFNSLLAIYCGLYFGWIKYNLLMDQHTNKFGGFFSGLRKKQLETHNN